MDGKMTRVFILRVWNMVEHRLVAVATIDDFKTKKSKLIEVEGHKLLLIRDGNDFFGVQRFCPHRGAPMRDAYVLHGLVVCSWHRSTFKLCDGSPVVGPSRCALQSVKGVVKEDQILIPVSFVDGEARVLLDG